MASKKRYFSIPNKKISHIVNRLKDTEQSNVKPMLDGTRRTKETSGIDVRRFMEYLELQSAKRVADRWKLNSSNLTSFIKIDLLDVTSGEQIGDVNNRKLNSYARKKSTGKQILYDHNQ